MASSLAPAVLRTPATWHYLADVGYRTTPKPANEWRGLPAAVLAATCMHQISFSSDFVLSQGGEQVRKQSLWLPDAECAQTFPIKSFWCKRCGKQLNTLSSENTSTTYPLPTPYHFSSDGSEHKAQKIQIARSRSASGK